MVNQERWLPALEKKDLLNLNDMRDVWGSITTVDLSYDLNGRNDILLKCFDDSGKLVYFESYDERDYDIAFQMASAISYMNGLQTEIYEEPIAYVVEEPKKKSFIKKILGK
jgi:hypothetical protein